jgi:hypothetical protein
MQRGSDKHSAWVDDELERETHSLTHGAPVESRVEEEWLEEDAVEDEPVPQPVVGERPSAEAEDEPERGLPASEIVARSDLGAHLRPGIFPATRAEVIGCAEAEHASAALLGQLRALPGRRYETVEDVWEALGGRPADRAPYTRDDDERSPVAPEAPSARGVPPGPRPAEGRDHTRMRFGFRFDAPYRVAALAFGITPGSAEVSIVTAGDGADLLRARFGPWVVETPLANVLATTATGPYHVLKTIGPPHVSLVDLGLTFATNGQRGLCIRFRTRVGGVEPTAHVLHPALTVTVDDVEGLAAAIAERTGSA